MFSNILCIEKLKSFKTNIYNCHSQEIKEFSTICFNFIFDVNFYLQSDRMTEELKTTFVLLKLTLT